MAKFNEMSAEQLAELSSKGGKASAESRCSNNLTMEDVVKEQVNNQVLRDLVRGLIASGKKGNVKAVEQLLKYLGDKPKDEKNEFEL
jgi:ribosomal protein L13